MNFLKSWKVGLGGVVFMLALWARLALKQHELDLMKTVAAAQVKEAESLKTETELKKHWAEIKRCSAQGHQPVMGFGFDVVCINNTAVEWTYESPPETTP